MKTNKCKLSYIILSFALITYFALGLPELNAKQEWVEGCKIKERSIWSETRKKVSLFANSGLPGFIELAGAFQAILNEYDKLQENVPGLENDCLSLIKERVKIAKLTKNLQNEGNNYNTQCYAKPKAKRCIRQYHSLTERKEAILQQKSEHQRKKASYYSQLLEYENVTNNLATQIKVGLLFICKEERKNLEKAVEEKRSQVRATQEALRRLDKSMQTGSEELEDWKKTTEEALESSWNQGREMLLNNLGDMIGVLSGDLEKWGGKDAVEVLESHLKDPELKKVVEELKEAKDALENLHWTSEMLKPTLENAQSKLTDALGNPKMQKMLKVGGQYAKYSTYLKSIVDSSYNITAEICAWQRINQMDKNSENYLKAVAKLDERMKKKVAEINDIKASLEKLQCY